MVIGFLAVGTIVLFVYWFVLPLVQDVMKEVERALEGVGPLEGQ
jgi:hypothetical protein